jgi:hypothetical protein
MLSEISTLLSDYVPLEIPELRRKKADSRKFSSTMVVVQALWNGLSSHPTNKIRGMLSNQMRQPLCGKNGAI